MKNIVIVGTSGVGKTFLEQELESLGISFQLPKYTNRPQRSGENSNKTICISSSEFKNLFLSQSFFFTLDYSGYQYGWKKSDLTLYSHLPTTLAITLDSLEQFLSQNPNFLSVLLTVDSSDLSLLEKRLHSREKLKSEIDRRLNLTRQELIQISKYIKLVNKHRGLMFYIKNDRTVFDEVIPKIIFKILSSKYHLNCIPVKIKPWGFTIGIQPNSTTNFIKHFFPNFKLLKQQVSSRFLVINPNSRLSWQWHQKRSELWKFINNPGGIMLSKNDLQPTNYIIANINSIVKVKPTIRHRIIGLETMAIVAETWVHTDINNPSDANDRVRIEDDYISQRILPPPAVNVIGKPHQY